MAFFLYLGSVLAITVAVGLLLRFRHERLSGMSMIVGSIVLGALGAVVALVLGLSGLKADGVGICLAFFGVLGQTLSTAVVKREVAYKDGGSEVVRRPAVVMGDDLRDGVALGGWVLIVFGLVVQLAVVTM